MEIKHHALERFLERYGKVLTENDYEEILLKAREKASTIRGVRTSQRMTIRHKGEVIGLVYGFKKDSIITFLPAKAWNGK